MRLLPHNDRIVCVLDEQFRENKSAGGLIIPDNAQRPPAIARITAVGPGWYDRDLKEYEPLPFAVGDTIAIPRYSGHELPIGDTTYLILKADEVLAKVEKTNDA